MTEEVLLSIDGFVAEIVLNRPRKLNAVTRAMAARLESLCAELDKNDQVQQARSTPDLIGLRAWLHDTDARVQRVGSRRWRTLKDMIEARHGTVARPLSAGRG